MLNGSTSSSSLPILATVVETASLRGDERDSAGVVGASGNQPTELSQGLLKENPSSKAKCHQGNSDTNNEGMDEYSSPRRMATGKIAGVTPQPPNDRLRQDTAASRAKHKSEEETPKRPVRNNNDEDDVVPSRLLKGTEALTGRLACSPKFTKQTEESKLLLQAKFQEMSLQEKEEQERIRLRKEEQKQKQKEQHEKITASLDQARERRERAAENERQRTDQLKAKISANEKRHARNTFQELLEVDSNLRPTTPKRTIPPLTVPIEPHFATDSRLGRTNRSPTSAAGRDTPAMAQGDDVLRRGLRTGSRLFNAKQSPSVRSTPRTTTIPKGPKFSTSHKPHSAGGDGDTAPSPSRLVIGRANVRAWEESLRDDPPASEPRKKGLSLTQQNKAPTVPILPKFHSLHRRERPKSTVEKELDEIKAHPFKALPLPKTDASNPRRDSQNHKMPRTEPRRLTVPKPFHLSTDSRAAMKAPPSSKEGDPTTTTHGHKSPQNAHQFRARPMPDFSSPSKTKTNATPESSNWSNRRVTQPEPFHFHTDDRIPISSPLRKKEESLPEIAVTPFKARPLPDFYGGSSGTKLESEITRLLSTHHHPKDVTVDELEVRIKPFRARPMPNFFSSSVPSVNYTPKFSSSSPSKRHVVPTAAALTTTTSPENVIVKEFKAQPMPDFSKPFVPAPSNPTERDIRMDLAQPPTESSSSTPLFKARPMPDFSKLELPARSNKAFSKRQERLRSKSTSPTPIRKLSPIAFKARQAPDFSNPFVPRRAEKISRIRSKSESPRAIRRSSSPRFKARPMPDFSKPLILVSPTRPTRARSPSKKPFVGKIPSSPARKTQPKIVRKPGGSPQFRAKPAPDFSNPWVPVTHCKRSPTKARSDAKIKSPISTDSSPRHEMDGMAISVFRARTLPDFSKQMIPVRDRDPNKLRSPETVKPLNVTNTDATATKKKEASPQPAKQEPYKPTVPAPPNFQRIHQRELPKSREEQELEDMEYFRSHPFRANPIKRFHFNFSPPKSVPSPATPEPFLLHTDSRARKGQSLTEPKRLAPKTPAQPQSFKEILRFRAGMSSTRSLQTSQSKKSLSTERSQPFHFFTDDRTAVSTPLRKRGGSADGDELTQGRSVVSSRSTEELIADLAGMEFQFKTKPKSPL
jgi:hypothetical protein